MVMEIVYAGPFGVRRRYWHRTRELVDGVPVVTYRCATPTPKPHLRPRRAAHEALAGEIAEAFASGDQLDIFIPLR